MRGLALMAPHFFTEDMGIAEIARAKVAFEQGNLRAKLARCTPIVDNAFHSWCDPWLDPDFRKWDITDALAYIRVPILIVQGENDQYGTVRQIEVAQEECYCPVEVALLPDTRHAPHREAPDGDARARSPISPTGCCATTTKAISPARRCRDAFREDKDPMADAERKLSNGKSRIDFQTDPSRYRHWKLAVDGDVATLLMDVDEKGTLFEGYELKLNSYDLGVDIELADAIERLRFEHPAGARSCCCARASRGCSAPAPISACWRAPPTPTRSTSASSPTRPATASRTPARLRACSTICVINGTAAGGGYELALAADHIMLVDDGSSTVSLPELPLLAVLPGTGGLTRVTDKRKVRRDHADVFCTTEEGIKGKRAVDWRLVDEVVPGSKFDETVAKRAQGIRREVRRGRPAPRASRSRRSSASARPTRSNTARVSVEFARAERLATITLRGPEAPPPASADAMVAQGAEFWPLRARARARRRHPRHPRSTSSTSPRSCSSRPAIPRRCSPTTHSSTPTRITGWRARSGTCGSACSSASISPRARWSRWSSRARASPARWPSSCSPPTAPTC